MSSRLRVMSFNIRHGASAVNRLDLSRTLEVIRGTEADVVALQEVDRRFGERSGYEDQPGRLAEGLSMDALYAPAITLPAPSGRAEPREYGVALLSKLPLEPLEMPVQDRRSDGTPAPDAPVPDDLIHSAPAPDAESVTASAAFPGRIPLPSARGVEGKDPEPRVALAARVDLAGRGGGEATVITTHLDAFTAQHRAAQAAHLATALAPLRGPAVLLGDMNTRAAAPELEQLRASGWREARAEHGALARALGRTFPALTPWRRIDQVHLRGPIELEALRTVRTWASDHFPIIADLRVR